MRYTLWPPAFAGKGGLMALNQQTILEKLHEILRGYPGNGELQLVVFLEDGTRVPMACKGMRLEINSQMRSRVEELLGAGNFKLLPTPAKKNGANGRSRRR